MTIERVNLTLGEPSLHSYITNRSRCAWTAILLDGGLRLPVVILGATMRVCVFVDGENLRHTICDLFEPDFDRREYLPKAADWARFFDYVVGLVTDNKGTRLRTYWYVVENVDPYPQLLKKQEQGGANLNVWAAKNEKLLHEVEIPADGNARKDALKTILRTAYEKRNNIKSRFDGYTILQNGISGKHRAIEFRRSGSISYNVLNGKFGQEKTVDVNLAVDMVTLAANYDVGVIVSGDQDYVPAAQTIKDMGKHVVNVAFKARNGVLLPGGAKRLNQVTDWSVELGFDEFKGFLNIPAKAPEAQPRA
jgi:hypothetical protein